MTISSNVRKAGPFTGNGTASAFPFYFKVFQASDLLVVKLTVSSSIETTLALTTDYTVTLNSDQDSNPGGTVTLVAGALATGFTLTITSDIGNLQPTDITNQGGFYPEVIEDSLDRATIQIQQLAEEANRALTLPLSTPSSVSTELPPPQANYLIAWNDAADGLQNVSTGDVATIASYGATRAELFSGTGSQTVFTLSENPGATANLDVSISGVTQRNGIDFNWVSGTNLTFMTAPPAGTNNILVRYVRALPAVIASATDVQFTPAGTGAVTRPVQTKLRETVSVKDFGAVGDGVANDTTAIQNAINYCTTNGAELFFPKGSYRTTSTLTIDRSSNNLDPTQGALFGISLRGSSPASAQILADHDGVCLSFIGGSSAGWHVYFYIDGLELVKKDFDRAAGSIGLKLDDAAYVQIQRFDISYFETGVYGVDVLSSAFMDGTIRLNNYGFKFEKGTRSHPNNISFRGVITINNQIWGGTLIKPSVFNYIGGSIESNGYTGVLADTNSWGLYVEQPGTEGSVGVNMEGVYLENNNGKADLWIVATGATGATTSINTLSGCSFLRFSNTRYVTNCILLDGANPTKLSLSGCGFKDYSPYVSDAARLWVAAGNAQVFDGGGNLWYDTAGGYVGLARAVFAPIGYNHQLPFASLPSVSEFRNGIQYCADGSGSSLPSLAVSDGTRWWQIVLGQFAGRVASAGTALRLPRGWSCTRTGTGVYVITHNLNLATNTYAVTATPSGTPGTGYCSGMVLSGNTFEIYFADTAGAAANMDFNFTMNII